MRLTAERLRNGVARANAAAVDREARFPHESVAAMRHAGMLRPLARNQCDGAEAPTLCDAVDCAQLLARECGASAMIWAMHHVQVACIARYGGPAFPTDMMASIMDGEWLVASITTERGIGGDLRRSGRRRGVL